MKKPINAEKQVKINEICVKIVHKLNTKRTKRITLILTLTLLLRYVDFHMTHLSITSPSQVVMKVPRSMVYSLSHTPKYTCVTIIVIFETTALNWFISRISNFIGHGLLNSVRCTKVFYSKSHEVKPQLHVVVIIKF